MKSISPIYEHVRTSVKYLLFHVVTSLTFLIHIKQTIIKFHSNPHQLPSISLTNPWLRLFFAHYRCEHGEYPSAFYSI